MTIIRLAVTGGFTGKSGAIYESIPIPCGVYGYWEISPASEKNNTK